MPTENTRPLQCSLHIFVTFLTNLKLPHPGLDEAQF
jgi:hypothetical protein